MTIILGSTSSGPDGFTTQSEYLGCGARARVKEEKARDMHRKGESWPPYAEEGKVVPTLVGTVAGFLIQSWHAGMKLDHRDTIAWGEQSLEESHPLTLAEARRVYEWYTDTIPLEKWGRYSGHEVPVTIPKDAYGHKLTGAIDLITTDEDGREWINDFKVRGKKSLFIMEEAGLRMQTFLYARARQLEGREIAGVRYLSIIRTDTIKLVNLEFPGLEEERLRAIENFFETVKAKRAAARPEPSEDHCLSYSRRCSFLDDAGLCQLL